MPPGTTNQHSALALRRRNQHEYLVGDQDQAKAIEANQREYRRRNVPIWGALISVIVALDASLLEYAPD